MNCFLQIWIDTAERIETDHEEDLEQDASTDRREWMLFEVLVLPESMNVVATDIAQDLANIALLVADPRPDVADPDFAPKLVADLDRTPPQDHHQYRHSPWMSLQQVVPTWTSPTHLCK